MFYMYYQSLSGYLDLIICKSAVSKLYLIALFEFAIAVITKHSIYVTSRAKSVINFKIINANWWSKSNQDSSLITHKREHKQWQPLDKEHITQVPGNTTIRCFLPRLKPSSTAQCSKRMNGGARAGTATGTNVDWAMAVATATCQLEWRFNKSHNSCAGDADVDISMEVAFSSRWQCCRVPRTADYMPHWRWLQRHRIHSLLQGNVFGFALTHAVPTPNPPGMSPVHMPMPRLHVLSAAHLSM